MKALRMMAVVALIAGFSLARPARADVQDLGTGLWTGEILYSGWSQSLAVNIERRGTAYTGSLGSVDWKLDEPIRNVEVEGDKVRIETDGLVLAGRVEGGRITGNVYQKNGNNKVGMFVLNHGPTPLYEPGSEPGFAGLH